LELVVHPLQIVIYLLLIQLTFFGIPFAADSSHMEGLARTSIDINWSTEGNTTANPIPGAIGATITKEVFAVNCVLNAVCDWNLIMMSSFNAIPNQCYSMQTALNM
jgi:hypothetical protein